MTLTPILEFHQTAGFGLPPTAGWTPITQWLDATMPAQINRGRADEQPAVSPSTLSLVLDNVDGRFTPGNASSPYYPNVSTPKWVRFSVTDGTTTWRRFTGLIDSWQPYMTGANSYKSVQVTAVDVLKSLGRDLRASVSHVSNKVLPLGSFLQEEVLLDTPLAYYPLGDGGNAQSFTDVSGNSQPPLQIVSQGSQGQISTGGSSGLATDALSAPTFTPFYVDGDVSLSQGKYLQTTLSTGVQIGSGKAFTMEWWMSVANNSPTPSAANSGQNNIYVGPALVDTGVATGTLIAGYYQTPPTGPTVPQEGGGLVTAQYAIAGAGPIVTGPELQSDNWYHFAFSCSTSGTLSFYINGVKWPWAQRGGSSPTVANTLSQFVVGSAPGFTTAYMNGSVAHVALYQAELSAARVQAHHLAGSTGFLGDTVTQRVVRILQYAGFGNLTGSPFLETSVLAVSGQTATSALSLLHEVETTEQGIFFISGAGDPTFYARPHRYDPTITPLSLDAQINTGNDVQPIFDEATVLNDVTVTTALGSSYRAVDSASTLQRGTYHTDIATISASPTNSDDTANWITFLYAQPQLRCRDVPVDLQTQPSIATAVLNTEIFTQLNLTNLPGGFTGFGNLVVQGMTESWGDSIKSIVFHTTPNVVLPANYVVAATGNDDSSTNRLGY